MLKAYFDPDKTVATEMYVRLLRKFVLPGTIFFSFLLRYADIENTLMPLNRIVEEDYTKNNRKCPWLTKIEVLNERVLAFDARHRDVVGSVKAKLGQAPTIREVVQSIIDNYDRAHKVWQVRMHRGWGLFRSMWLASVLLDRRLDRHDPETRAWLTVFTILGSGCLAASMCSLYLLFMCTDEHSWQGFFLMIKLLVTGDLAMIDTESMLANAVLLLHGLLIVVFIYRTICSMFYFKMKEHALTDWVIGAPRTPSRSGSSPTGAER